MNRHSDDGWQVVLAKCDVEVEPGRRCGWQVPWDKHGKALMEEHFRDKHPNIDLYKQ